MVQWRLMLDMINKSFKNAGVTFNFDDNEDKQILTIIKKMMSMKW